MYFTCIGNAKFDYSVIFMYNLILQRANDQYLYYQVVGMLNLF